MDLKSFEVWIRPSLKQNFRKVHWTARLVNTWYKYNSRISFCFSVNQTGPKLFTFVLSVIHSSSLPEDLASLDFFFCFRPQAVVCQIVEAAVSAKDPSWNFKGTASNPFFRKQNYLFICFLMVQIFLLMCSFEFTSSFISSFKRYSNFVFCSI